MLRIGPAAGRGVIEASASIFLRGKRRSDGAVAALAVTGVLGGDAGGALRYLETATYCAVDKQAHNM